MLRPRRAEGLLRRKPSLEINAMQEVLISRGQFITLRECHHEIDVPSRNTLNHFFKRLFLPLLRTPVTASLTHFRSLLPSHTFLTATQSHRILSLPQGPFDRNHLHHIPYLKNLM